MKRLDHWNVVGLYFAILKLKASTSAFLHRIYNSGAIWIWIITSDPEQRLARKLKTVGK
jgi:hypothetical protein